jgi:secreted PhoX family phosphatase
VTPLRDLLDLRLRRRSALGLLGATAFAASAGARPAAGPDHGFDEVPHGEDPDLHVPPGHRVDVVASWGDALHADMAPFDPRRQSSTEQARRVGFNCDFTAYLPLPGKDPNKHGLLCINHETFDTSYVKLGARADDWVDVALNGHGHTVVEVERTASGWVRRPGRYSRRITGQSPLTLTGPAAGHPRLRTKADPSGRTVLGTLSNCSGGVTPWGTVLFCEENLQEYFEGRAPKGHPERRAHERYQVQSEAYGYAATHERFRADRHPTEPNRFGWVVEIDPYRPELGAVKRTALGRMFHEAAVPVLCGDGRVAVYTCDDRIDEYLYRFVSRDKADLKDREANWGLLDHGTLEVAVFDEEGVTFKPLVYGQGPLTREQGFTSQADVLIEARRAADLVGATPLDRPEGIAIDPRLGAVFVSLSKNAERTTTSAVCPRPANEAGHIIELRPPRRTAHAASRMAWDIVLLAGDPRGGSGARYGKGITPNGWLQNPDNLAVDRRGRLWIATDSYGKAPFADGLWVCPTRGPFRGSTRRFLRVPAGAEACSPAFTPDGSTLFVAIQHPGGANATQPLSRWPDGGVPRPSVVAITREDSRPVGA